MGGVRVALTMGDPAGIGPEVLVEALARFKKTGGVKFFVAGDRPQLVRYGLRSCGNVIFRTSENMGAARIRPGHPTPRSAQASIGYLKEAVSWMRNKEADCLVTGPISKAHIRACGFSWPGQTEYLADAFDAKDVEMIFVSERLKVALVTRHVSVKNALRAVSKERIETCGRLVFDLLKNKFRIRSPRIAVCGLNPHAGEAGLFGGEEKACIAPAVSGLNKELGQHFYGPYSPDAVFRLALGGAFDLVMAMYHDQGLIPFKLAAFETGAHLTLGLPFVRTSPVHGTGFDIAGKNMASAGSMTAALELAVRLTLKNTHRRRF